MSENFKDSSYYRGETPLEKAWREDRKKMDKKMDEETQLPQQESSELALAQPAEADTALYTKFQRDGRLLMASAFLPEHFNSPKETKERRLANICVAMELASHFPTFPQISVLQQVYFVGGQPAWKSSFVMSLLKSQGLKVQYEEEGDWEAPDEKTRTRCIAADKDGIRYASIWITPTLVRKEGWDKRTGSKWLSMPAQMARYRSATYLARAYWPELLMGYYTTDERADFTDGKAPEDDFPVVDETEQYGG